MSEAISGPFPCGEVGPACRFAHAGYEVSSIFICSPPNPPSFAFLSSISHPDEGAGGAPIGARMLRLHPDACMTARGLSLSRREPGAGATRRHASRRSTVTFFGTRPSILFSFFPGPGSNGCSWGRGSRVLGVVLPGTVANRSGDATPCSALQDRLRWAPLMNKAGAMYK